jgi:hypothetical protein
MNDWADFPSLDSQQHEKVESVCVFGVTLKAGDRVRLWPQSSADIMDLALKGKVAVIEALERDLDDKIHLAVVLEDDPGRDLGMMRMPGHRFFFSPEDIEPLSPESRGDG